MKKIIRIDNTRMRQIYEQTIDRYNKRLKLYGENPKTLGWISKKDQNVRFNKATEIIDFNNQSVLDIGCGFADFLSFLKNTKIKIKKYKGIDINHNLIAFAKKRFPGNNFEIRNILINNYNTKQADIVIALGLLNFKLKTADNLVFSKRFIEEAWKITKKVLIIDFLSSFRIKEYLKENLVYYHNPKDILNLALKLTNNIVLIHDYRAIPQKEFMIILKR